MQIVVPHEQRVFFTPSAMSQGARKHESDQVIIIEEHHDNLAQPRLYLRIRVRAGSKVKRRKEVFSRPKSTPFFRVRPQKFAKCTSRVFYEGSFFVRFFLSPFYFSASGQALVLGVVASPRYVPSAFIAHRVEHSHRSSIFVECCTDASTWE